ncbi:MAG: amidohydrolase family protein [bacterium]|nr:amidohydrolase family protein [bacterium]
MRKVLPIILFFGIFIFKIHAQENFPTNGPKDERPQIYAFTNATIFTDYQTKLENATIVIKEGRILSVGSSISIPKGAIVKDMQGKFIYPSWVEPYGNYGLPEVPKVKSNWRSSAPQYYSKKEGAYGWNENVLAEYDAIENFQMKDKDATTLKKLGFGAVNSIMENGIIRGTSTVVSLAAAPDQNVIIKDKGSLNMSFQNAASSQEYPNSIMGRVALIRQTYYDAEWYKSSNNQTQTNLSLEAFNAAQNLPVIFEVNGKQRVLLADKVGDEFGKQYIIKGTGDEYQRVQDIKNTGASLILALNFPKAYDVDDPYQALSVSLNQMKHWEMAPANAKLLNDQGVEFAFTADGLKKKGQYLENIRTTVKYGLDESEALKAMTYTPAKLLGVHNQVGSLKKGMHANLLITSGNIFDTETTLHENWVMGTKTVIVDMDTPDHSGKYDLKIGSDTYSMEISGKPGRHGVKIKPNDSTDYKTKATFEGENINFSFKAGKDEEGGIRASGYAVTNGFKGKAQLADGTWADWSATRSGDLEPKEKKDKESDDAPELGKVIYPFVAFGSEQIPQQETILFKNATVWTNEKDGILTKTDVLVKDGKIAQVGKGISISGAKVIDATGKHLTSGIIDEHSHAALSGVNEGSHAVTAEVRMYDAVNAEDVNIYRQLAGGVTAAQLLHGSANPVGGQSALVKFRWGMSPQQMRIQGADEYIKFALGENVKQSNWGDNQNIRFPQTRMGVEQVYMDAFTRAKQYDQEWSKYNALSAKAKRTATKPRRDLQLEALAEIINSERFITCHSYVQSEINMLMKVAEKFNFNINTFTHILEGYKVADKMAKHGAGGSTFSDWWAYKFEVKEAIPYNAALMTQAGVTVAINSDDREMARRLNQEAAKSVKYGGVSEEEAWKMVTLNAAKLLHLDDRMGSVKVGKDADLVLWSDNPLSIYAKAEKTMVDGTVYFDLEKDETLRQEIEKERIRLINKMRGAKKSGKPTQKPSPKIDHEWHCGDIVIEGNYGSEE